MSSRVSILSAGAAESLVTRLMKTSVDEGTEIVPTFGAVGVTKESFLAGEDCDLFISSARGIAELRDTGQLDAEAVRDIGWVQTGIAIRTGDPTPDVSSETAVAEALGAAPVLFSPDPVRSTAGAHFRTVLNRVGMSDEAQALVSFHPNGATAMRALALEGRAGALGCTQVTEILQTDGVTLAGPLPPPFDLATRYQCALVRDPSDSPAATQVFELLTGPSTAALREELGFTQGESG
jgi:molybdate transport system substrate-binding protein